MEVMNPERLTSKEGGVKDPPRPQSFSGKSALLWMACAALVGCAGANLAKFAEQTGLPEELGQDGREQFTAREFSPPTENAAAVAPRPSPSPSLRQASKNGAKQTTTTQSSAAGSVAVPKREAGKAGVAHRPLSEVYPLRRPVVDPFWVGEKFVFDVSYLGVVVGTCELEILPPKVISDRKAYHVKGKAWSNKMFSLVYRVNDWMETLFDYESIISHKYRLVLDESKQSRDLQEFNDPVKMKTFYWSRHDQAGKGFKETKVFADIPPLAQDGLSQVYYIRTLPLKDGDFYQFNTANEGKIFDTSVKVLGREKFQAPWGEVNAIKLLPEAKYHGRLKKAGDSFMWVTDDDRRVILKMEARVKVGTVTAELAQFKPGVGPISALSGLQSVQHSAEEKPSPRGYSPRVEAAPPPRYFK
jgi:hypothetical protein